MLLKERICTFEEVQDHARALLDGLIGKYSIETQQQVSIFLNYVFMFSYISLVDE